MNNEVIIQIVESPFNHLKQSDNQIWNEMHVIIKDGNC